VCWFKTLEISLQELCSINLPLSPDENIAYNKKLSRCAFFVEKCIPFTNSAL